jgi:hypothetical protein
MKRDKKRKKRRKKNMTMASEPFLKNERTQSVKGFFVFQPTQRKKTGRMICWGGGHTGGKYRDKRGKKKKT